MILKIQHLKKAENEDIKELLVWTNQVNVYIKKINNIDEAKKYQEFQLAPIFNKDTNEFSIKPSIFARYEDVDVKDYPVNAYIVTIKKGRDEEGNTTYQKILTYNSLIYLCNSDTGKTIDILSKKVK